MSKKFSFDSSTPRHTYDSAPVESPVLQGMPVTPRQLKRAVELGKLSRTKFGLRVLLSDDDLQEWLDRATVKAVR